MICVDHSTVAKTICKTGGVLRLAYNKLTWDRTRGGHGNFPPWLFSVLQNHRLPKPRIPGVGAWWILTWILVKPWTTAHQTLAARAKDKMAPKGSLRNMNANCMLRVYLEQNNYANPNYNLMQMWLNVCFELCFYTFLAPTTQPTNRKTPFTEAAQAYCWKACCHSCSQFPKWLISFFLHFHFAPSCVFCFCCVCSWPQPRMVFVASGHSPVVPTCALHVFLFIAP